MTALFALTQHTIRSAFRSYIFHVNLLVLLAGIFLLPLTISHDGTGIGQIRLSLTYSLGFVTVMLTITTLWSSCITIAEDIASKRIHHIVSKPVPRYIYWFARSLGIILLHGVLLGISATVIFCLVNWKINHTDLPEDEILQLRQEVLTCRRVYRPVETDFKEVAERELKRQVQAGKIQAGTNPSSALKEIQRQLRLRASELRVNKKKLWRFGKLPGVQNGSTLYLRYRGYTESPKARNQRDTEGLWIISREGSEIQYAIPQQFKTGSFLEISIPASAINHEQGAFFEIEYENRDPRSRPIYFQPSDGPFLLIKVAEFWENYIRVIVLIFMQLVFLAILGCTAGSLFSTPMAIFISFSYVIIGILILLLDGVSGGQATTSSPSMISDVAAIVRVIASYVTMSVNEAFEVKRLVAGELIEFRRMIYLFTQLVIFRGVPIAIIGIWHLNRRELAR